tara:strand:+ start:858 stop:1817 length:960 start_codon:yes stop_codon:yes gene_type:complete
MKSALITGINGQDGSYLAEHLLSKGYDVHGIVRRNSVCENQTARLDEVFNDITLHYGDTTDMSSILRILDKSQPTEVYNLAAQSHVRISFDEPIYTTEVVAVGTLNMLEATRNSDVKFYQASSSEMFGNSVDADGYQRETTPMNPVSPYGCAKLYGYNICRNYRASYDRFICNGILFNHESPRRGTNFVTSKVVKGACDIVRGSKKPLFMGNLDATRDWGHAADYVKAMWQIMQLDSADDFVCSTGVSHSVRDLCECVFSSLNMNYEDHVLIDEKYYRPEELTDLKGDCGKLVAATGWMPTYSFEDMIDEMIRVELDNG